MPSLLFVLFGWSPSDLWPGSEGLGLLFSRSHKVVLFLDEIVLPLRWTRIWWQVLIGDLPFLLYLFLST